MKDSHIIYCLITVIIILLIYIYYIHSQEFNNRINGSFVGDPDFIEKSGLEKCILHLNNKKGYLYLSNANNVIYNDVITFKYNSNKLYIPELSDLWKTDNHYIMDFDTVNNVLDIYDANKDTLFMSLNRLPDKVDDENDSEKI